MREIICSTVIYHEIDVFEALDYIASDGFGYIELVIVPGFCPHFDLQGSDLDSDVKDLKESLKDHNLSVCSLNIAPGSLGWIDTERVVEFFMRGVDLAVKLGIDLLTIPSGRRVPRQVWGQAVTEVSRYIKRIADYAEQRGVTISIESPHLNTLTEDIGESTKLFERLSDDRIGCTFDTSHVARGRKTSLMEGLRTIGVERIKNVHLRDMLDENISITPGKGQADFRRFFLELQRNNYEGQLVLELEYRGITEEQKRSELRFAKRYVKSLWLDSSLPLALKIQTLPLVQFFERLRRDPRREIRRYPRLINILRKLRAPFKASRRYLQRLKPIRTYDGYWQDKRYIFRQKRPVSPKANSVSLLSPPAQTVRACILGCGFAGTRHGLGYQRLIGVEVVGVCDVNVDKAETLGHQLGCASYTSLEEMLEAEQPDLVSVCTMEWQHYDPVMQLLEADVDVFCEKIMASSYQEAREMVEIAKARRRVLAVNYNYRFIPGVRKLKQVIQSQCLGRMQLLNIKAHALSYHHALDLVSFLGGQIHSVHASYQNDDALRSYKKADWSQYDPDILYVPSRNLAAIFEVKDGAVAALTSSLFYDHTGFILGIDAIFDKGSVSLTGINTLDAIGRFTWASINGHVPNIDMDYHEDIFARGLEYSFYKSVESFVNAYVIDKSPETPGEQGLFNMYIEKVVFEANATGQRVMLDVDQRVLSRS